MRFFVGTSGYSYKEWKGSFYPEKLPQKDMLRYYGERFSTVEINNTFYQLPKVPVLEAWAEQVPAEFRFVLKASQRITHQKRLKDVGDETEYLFRAARALQQRLGPMLFQLPPNLKKDLPRLEAFLQLLQADAVVAFEFRNASWFDDEVFARLRETNCALCTADIDEDSFPDLVPTTGWGYVRLRREEYTDDELSGWIKRLQDTGWNEAYVFFKHEDAGTGPKLAARFLQLAAK